MRKIYLAMTILVTVVNARAEDMYVAKNSSPQAESRSSSGIYSSSSSSAISRVTPQMEILTSNFGGSGAEVSGGSLDNKTAFGVGATMDIGHGDLVFETGVKYRQMGSNLTIDNTNVSGKLELDYLAIPLLAKFFVNGAQAPTAFYVKGGLQPSFLVSKKLSVTDGTNSASTRSISVNDTDFPIVVGGGANFEISQSSVFTAEINYTRGITSISKSGGDNVYNVGVGLVAGLGFAF